MLLDEPFSALDTGLRQALREDVRAALHATGATAVLVTHDQQEALSIADVVAVMHDGVVVQAAEPSAVYTSPGDLGVATFVGEAVVVPAVVRDGVAETLLGSLPVRGRPALGAGEVLVRPEQVVLGPPGSGVRAQVRGTVFYGHDALVQLELDPLATGTGSPVLVSARTHGHEVAPDGTMVGLRVSGEVAFFPGPAAAERELAPLPVQ